MYLVVFVRVVLRQQLFIGETEFERTPKRMLEAEPLLEIIFFGPLINKTKVLHLLCAFQTFPICWLQRYEI